MEQKPMCMAMGNLNTQEVRKLGQGFHNSPGTKPQFSVIISTVTGLIFTGICSQSSTDNKKNYHSLAQYQGKNENKTTNTHYWETPVSMQKKFCMF